MDAGVIFYSSIYDCTQSRGVEKNCREPGAGSQEQGAAGREKAARAIAPAVPSQRLFYQPALTQVDGHELVHGCLGAGHYVIRAPAGAEFPGVNHVHNLLRVQHEDDLEESPIPALFKLYPWEWMVADRFGEKLLLDTVRVFEPAWKMLKLFSSSD